MSLKAKRQHFPLSKLPPHDIRSRTSNVDDDGRVGNGDGSEEKENEGKVFLPRRSVVEFATEERMKQSKGYRGGRGEKGEGGKNLCPVVVVARPKPIARR